MKKTIKELEMLACEKFVCPNIGIIEEKGKLLNLKERTIERAKKLAIEYFKKTYHRPHYSSARHVLPAFVYIASILESDRRSQIEISSAFSTTKVTIIRWYKDILKVLNIELVAQEEHMPLDISSLIDEIEREGIALSLRHETIEKAKTLTLKYVDIADTNKYFPYVKQLLPAFIYTASVIENDKRTQYEISEVSDVKESVISKWYNDILRVLNMKVISNCGHVICVKKIREY